MYTFYSGGAPFWGVGVPPTTGPGYGAELIWISFPSLDYAYFSVQSDNIDIIHLNITEQLKTYPV